MLKPKRRLWGEGHGHKGQIRHAWKGLVPRHVYGKYKRCTSLGMGAMTNNFVGANTQRQRWCRRQRQRLGDNIRSPELSPVSLNWPKMKPLDCKKIFLRFDTVTYYLTHSPVWPLNQDIIKTNNLIHFYTVWPIVTHFLPHLWLVLTKISSRQFVCARV